MLQKVDVEGAFFKLKRITALTSDCYVKCIAYDVPRIMSVIFGILEVAQPKPNGPQPRKMQTNLARGRFRSKWPP